MDQENSGQAETCRICRCGEEEGKLYYPCRCSGTVKYVHSDCLLEWLNSSRRAPKCEICGSVYKFRPLLPEGAPEHISSWIVVTELVKTRVKSFLDNYAPLVLCGLVLLTVFPMAAIISIRLGSILIDGWLSKGNELLSLLAGNLPNVPSNSNFDLQTLLLCSKYSYPTGIKIVLTVLLFALQTMVLQEWVSKDSGFDQLIKLKIGDENLSRVVDNSIRAFIVEQVIPGNANITKRDFIKLLKLHEMSFITQARNIATIDITDEQLQREYQKARRLALEKMSDILPFINDIEPFDFENSDQLFDIASFTSSKEEEEFIEAEELPPQEDLRNLFFKFEDPVIPEDEEAGGLGLRIDIRINLQEGLRTILVGTVIFCVVVTPMYFCLSSSGILFFQILYGGLLWALSYLKPLARFVEFKDSQFQKEIVLLIEEYTRPWIAELNAVYNHQHPVSLTGRIIPLATNVFVFFVVGKMLMYILESSFRTKFVPLKGFKRSLYRSIFDIFSVMKVMTIFATEIVAFPLFCGLLLDFVLSPVLVLDANFMSTNNLFISNLLFDWIKNDKFLMFGIYWSSGTIYMCLFAIFVGMIRRFVLRPGVLFFIRSPDDMNTRFVHDAFVRPFGLQISRILLSGAVYTAFILFGFGLITFPLRYWLHVLPVKVNFASTYLYASLYVLYFKLYKKLVPDLRKFVRLYWSIAIKDAAKKTRLSSFIAGADIAKERGKVVYRSWYDYFFTKEDLDYNSPIAKYEVEEYFATHPKARSAFVFDGHWVKAPNNDNVSRLYLRQLFYPVKADGTDFEDFDRSVFNNNRRIDNLLGEKDEIDQIRSHVVVFRPSNFGIRNFLFVTLLWFYAALLIISVIILSQMLGMPVSYLLGSNFLNLPDWCLNVVFLGYFSDHKVDSICNLSYSSLSIGIVIFLVLLKEVNHYIKYRIQRQDLFDDITDVEDDSYPFMESIREFASSQSIFPIINKVSTVIMILLWSFYIVFSTKYVSPYSLLKANPKNPTRSLPDDVKFLQNLNYEEFAPLAQKFIQSVFDLWSARSFVGNLCQVLVLIAQVIPLISALRSPYLAHSFAQIVGYNLPVVAILSIVSFYMTGSVVPGLIGTLHRSMYLWETPLLVPNLWHLFDSYDRLIRNVVNTYGTEIRNKYYSVGVELMDYDEL